MLLCSQCRFENPDGSEACGRCGRGLKTETPEAPSAAITVVDGARRLAAAAASAAQVVASTDTPPQVEHPGINVDSIRIQGLTSIEDPSPVAETTKEPPAQLQPKLVVVRGERLGVEYKILEGKNYIGRTSDRAVDIDLDGQEALDRTWTSRQHAVLTYEQGMLVIEDLSSLNGTFVNRSRLHPGQQRVLQAGDIVQVGTVQLRVVC